MTHQTHPSLWDRLCSGVNGTLLVVLTGLLTFNSPATAGAGLVSAAYLFAAATVGQEIKTAHVLGSTACQECHQSEINAWQQSAHAKKSFAMLKTNPKAKEFGSELGIADVTSGSAVCTTCHGLRQGEAAQLTVLSGNSCEACHGGAGPREGSWFAIHSDYGGKDVDRDAETQAHFQQRIAQCEELGMNGSGNIYELAKNCYECHTVPDETVVNAGHPTGNPQFEFLAWVQGEVRHNYQMNQKENAAAPTLWTNARFTEGRTEQGRHRLMYVVGQLVDLEVSLRNRAQASSKGNYSDAAGKRILAARKELRKIDKAVKLPDLGTALTAVKSLKRSKLRKFNAGDEQLYGDIADKLAASAKQLADTNDGSQLQKIDSLLPKASKGTAQP